MQETRSRSSLQRSAQETADGAAKLGFGFEPSLVRRFEDVLDELSQVRAIGLRKFGEERVESGSSLADEAEQPILLALGRGIVHGNRAGAPAFAESGHARLDRREVRVAKERADAPELPVSRGSTLDALHAADRVDELFGELELHEPRFRESRKIFAQPRKSLLLHAIGALLIGARPEFVHRGKEA